jgi:hypothetical protein
MRVLNVSATAAAAGRALACPGVLLQLRERGAEDELVCKAAEQPAAAGRELRRSSHARV